MLSSKSPTLICLAAFVVTPALTAGQNSSPAAPTKPLSFEVVSIRLSPPDANISFQRTPDGFRGTGLTLTSVILLAYRPAWLTSTIQVQNAPAWVARNRYDINAKVAPQDLKAWSSQRLAEPTVMRAMLLSMLADRCHLQFHTIPAQISGFALAVSRRGTSLQPSTAGGPVPNGMRLMDGGIAISEKKDDGTWTLHFHDASIASLTSFLSMHAHTDVLDQTGLTGRYDFALTVIPDASANDGYIPDPASIYDLRALGLRTVSTKVPTINIVVDHIEPPSDN
jgi:uncharacterized protein (TIGR03435 family)